MPSVSPDAKEARRRLEEFNQIPVDDIKAASDVAWILTMKEECTCGAESRSSCSCRRTEEYKRKAQEIRDVWFGEKWENAVDDVIAVSLDAFRQLGSP